MSEPSAQTRLDRIETKLDRILEETDEMKSLLTGCDEPARGLVVRVDRLEQESKRAKAAEKRIVATVWAFIGSAAAAAGAWVFAKLSGKSP